MTQTVAVDIAARMRASMRAARDTEPTDVDQRARCFIMLLAGALQQADPQLAAELFTVMVNTSMPQQGGVNLLVTGSAQ